MWRILVHLVRLIVRGVRKIQANAIDAKMDTESKNNSFNVKNVFHFAKNVDKIQHIVNNVMMVML